MNDIGLLTNASQYVIDNGCDACEAGNTGTDDQYPLRCFAQGTDNNYQSRHVLLVRFPGARTEDFLQYDMCGTYSHLVPSPSPPSSLSASPPSVAPPASAAPPACHGPATIPTRYTLWGEGVPGTPNDTWLPGGKVGIAVANAGDVDGSGTDDLLVTEWDSRRVWLAFTSSSGDMSVERLVHVAPGDTTGTVFKGVQFGQALAGLGALHGSAGLTTVAIGAPNYLAPGAGTIRGAVALVTLDTNGTLVNYTLVAQGRQGFDGLVGSQYQQPDFGRSMTAIPASSGGSGAGDYHLESLGCSAGCRAVLAVGARRFNAVEPVERGAVFVLSLNGTGYVLHTIRVSQAMPGGSRLLLPLPASEEGFILGD